MATARSQQQSGLPADYYVPDYLVEVGGKALDPETKGDVIDLKVKQIGRASCRERVCYPV